jgi:hypothetical protein
LETVTFSVPACPGRSLPAALALKIVVFHKGFHLKIVTFPVPAAPARSLPAALALNILVFLKVFISKSLRFRSWRLLAAPGGSWRLLAAPGGSWRLLAAPGGSWRPLAYNGTSWAGLRSVVVVGRSEVCIYSMIAPWTERDRKSPWSSLFQDVVSLTHRAGKLGMGLTEGSLDLNSPHKVGEKALSEWISSSEGDRGDPWM